MGKIVLKSALFTLAGIVLCLGILFGMLAWLSPISLAKFFDGMGMYSASVTFYESNFNKTKELGDLSTLIVKIDVEKDSERAEKYLEILVESEHFENYCIVNDGVSQSNISSKDFYLGEYVYALILNGKFETALSLSFEYVGENGYTQNNPARIMVIHAKDLLTEQQVYTLKQKIYECRISLSDPNHVSLANLDADALSQII